MRPGRRPNACATAYLNARHSPGRRLRLCPPSWRRRSTTISIASLPATTTTAISSRSGATAVGNKYVIPYNGEEVLLYWANLDQYYVKTGEYFSDYRFAVEPAIRLRGGDGPLQAAPGHGRAEQRQGGKALLRAGRRRSGAVGPGRPHPHHRFRVPTADRRRATACRQPWPAGQAQRGGRGRRAQGHPGRAAAGAVGQAAGRAGQGEVAAGAAPGPLHRPEHARLLHPQGPGRLPAPRAGFLPQERGAEPGGPGLEPAGPGAGHRGPLKTLRPSPADHRLSGPDRGLPEAAVGEAQVRGAERLVRDPGPCAGRAVRRDRGQRAASGPSGSAVRRGAGAGRRSGRSIPS